MRWSRPECTIVLMKNKDRQRELVWRNSGLRYNGFQTLELDTTFFCWHHTRTCYGFDVVWPFFSCTRVILYLLELKSSTSPKDISAYLFRLLTSNTKNVSRSSPALPHSSEMLAIICWPSSAVLPFCTSKVFHVVTLYTLGHETYRILYGLF